MAEVECPICVGSGYVECPECEGSGLIDEEYESDVRRYMTVIDGGKGKEIKGGGSDA
jgi:DnaJ-class molecular chaperone